MRRPMWRAAAWAPVVTLFLIALWWARPTGVPLPATVASQSTKISHQVATIAALETRIAATSPASPAASPSVIFPSRAPVAEYRVRGSGKGATASVRIEAGIVVTEIAYHGDGTLIVWLESDTGERRQVVDEIGPWDGTVEIEVDAPGTYRFAVEADGGPWTIRIKQLGNGS